MNVNGLVSVIAIRMKMAASLSGAISLARAQGDNQTACALLSILQKMNALDVERTTA